MKLFFSYLYSTLILCGVLVNDLQAQNKPNTSQQPKPAQRIVQVSGLVVTGENAVGVPGVNFFVPKAGRGVRTNGYGYFSMPTLAGDSAVVSAVGFKRQSYVVPNDERQSISVVIFLQADTTQLPVIEVFPFATEKDFKDAFLSLKLPQSDMDHMRKNLDENILARMRYEMPMSASMNHNFYMKQQVTGMESRGFSPTLQLTNPFAWARFIESVKNGDLKRKKWKDD